MLIAALFCSCSNVKIATDEYFYLAADSLTEELESQGVNVKETTVDLKLSGGPGCATIVISIDDCTDEGAERIFEEVIFPYMSRDNYFVENLMMPECIVSRYCIMLSCGDGTYSYSSEYASQRCELWENGDDIVCLEDYR